MARLFLVVAAIAALFASAANAGTNTNQCLALLGGLNANCPQDQLVPTLACCIAVSNFNKAGCFCNPTIPALAGESNVNLIKLVVKPACAVLGVNPLWWKQMKDNKVNWGIVLCYPYNTHNYNGGQCAKTDMELDSLRIQSSIGVSTVIQDYVADPACFNYNNYRAALGAFLDPVPNVIVSLGIGAYTDLDSAVEYLALATPAVNKDFWKFQGAPNPQLDPRQMLYITEDGKMIVLGGTGGGLWWKQCSASQPVYMEQDISFEGCNTVIKTYYVPTQSILTGNNTGLYNFVNKFVLAAQQSKTWGFENVCGYHETYCLGPNKQFANKAECMSFMQSLPAISPACGNDLVMSGNSSTCRFKHAFMIPLAPEAHCFHIGRGLVADAHGKFKCNDATECTPTNLARGQGQYLSTTALPEDAACVASDNAAYTGWVAPSRICPESYAPGLPTSGRRVLRTSD